MPVAYKLTMNRAVVDRIGGDAAYAHVVDTVRQVLNQATIDTPVDTGRLRAGNQSHVDRRGTLAVGVVFNNTNYAAAVHDGTKAHIIRPKTPRVRAGKKFKGGVLRFEVGGEVVYARQVKMPARKGRPWLLNALIKVAGRRGYTVTRL